VADDVLVNEALVASSGMTNASLYAERSSTAGAYETAREPVQALVPISARRILDVGCAAGAVGASLKARQGAEVVGLDINPDYAAEASERLDRFICGNLEDFVQEDLEHEIGTFDCIVAADVLEHLRGPWQVLDRLVTVLKPGGYVVVSLPNVRYLATALNVYIRGTWPRERVGLFDATHLRWFTERDMVAMLTGAGLTVERVDHLFRLLTRRTKYDWIAQYFGPLRPFFAYQNLALARKPGQ
jgi:2-polyprenyl-3-methyl-5-hydroxy-6-metoxy-1,4-benzoquinol methylase